MYKCKILNISLLILMAGAGIKAQVPVLEASNTPPPGLEIVADSRAYVLGFGDQLTLWAVEAEEINGKSFSIDQSGYLALPLVGRVRAAGFTVDQFEAELKTALGKYIRQPQIVVAVTEPKSEPVSITGAVNTPGVYQLNGSKSLAEMLAEAGGLSQDAGHLVRITRQLKYGHIPVPKAVDDSTNGVSAAEISVQDALAGKSGNIPIFPNDLIMVSGRGMVYVLGDVTKPGAYPIGERPTISLLQALAIAGGLAKTASPNNMKLIHPVPGGARQEMDIDGSKIIQGKAPDVELQPNDILYIRDSLGKRANRRAAEALVQAATFMLGWAIYR
jgi:polysaccharide export outer membrane protein